MDPNPLIEIERAIPALLYVVGGIGLWKAVYSAAKTAEEVLSDDAKENFAIRLLLLNPSEKVGSWPTRCLKVFNAIFGDRHLSLRCLLASCVSSLIAVGCLTAFYVATRPLFGPSSDLIRVAGWVLVLNAGFDYIALLATRIVLRSMATSSRLSPVRGMGLSFLVNFVLASNAALNIGFMAAMFTAGTFLNPLSWILTLYANFTVFLPALPAAIGMKIPAGIFFWSTFCIWFWVLLYACAEALLISVRWMEGLRGYLDVEKKPVAAIGFVMGGLGATAWWIACAVAWVVHR